jgi:hypothetical protein
MKIDLKERFKLFITQTENYDFISKNQPSIHDLIDLLNFISLCIKIVLVFLNLSTRFLL